MKPSELDAPTEEEQRRHFLLGSGPHPSVPRSFSCHLGNESTLGCDVDPLPPSEAGQHLCALLFPLVCRQNPTQGASRAQLGL